MTATVHVVGAGLAGLAAARKLAAAGASVQLHEAAGQAGGRCRSWHDPLLGRRIDNGNHLMLSGNRALARYLAALGATDRVAELPAGIGFYDLASGRRWTVRPGWRPFRQTPFAPARALAGALPLLWAGPRQSCAAALRGTGPAYRAFWHPLAQAVLNTPPATGSARLLRATLAETAARGPAACRSWVARASLGDALIDPALADLAARGGRVAYHRRLRRLERAGDRVAGLHFADGTAFRVGADEAVVLAVPAAAAARLLPELGIPQGHHAIANLHFRLPEPRAGGPAVLGLVGGLAEWVFDRGELGSATIGVADALMGESEANLLARVWPELRAGLGLPGDMAQPPGRVVKERRATLAQTPAADARRPGPGAPGLTNLRLAGDWTATGLPATVEGAIRSGEAAAAAVLSSTS